MPPQSAPPCAGSQLSLGLSMQVNPLEQVKPAMPPQKSPGLLGAFTQLQSYSLHTYPAEHFASVALHVDGRHTPPQSAPPLFGSQVSRGSSMQMSVPSQGKPPKPPQLLLQ